MQSSDKTATILSVAALILGVVNLILSSPYLIELYTQPKLVVSEVKRRIEGEKFEAFFVLKNSGRGTAKSVEAKFNVHAKDSIHIIHGSIGKIEETPNGPHFKTVRISSEYLAPNESISLFVTGSKQQLVKDSSSFNSSDLRFANIVIPAAISLKSEQGLGDIQNQRAWYQVNAETSN